jgi:hypothetical protein
MLSFFAALRISCAGEETIWHVRFFAEFTLERSEGLRMTRRMTS